MLTIIELPDNIFVLTPNGYKLIRYAIKLPPQPVCTITTDSGKNLMCAVDHRVFTHDHEPIFAKNTRGCHIQTTQGIELVVSVEVHDDPQDCYDLQVDDHEYFTNGLLSHNSTITAIFLLHYILFNDHKTVAILANKKASAVEILSRLKTAYSMLPKFLQQGIVKWNDSSIELENGCRVISSASSASNIRGQAISLLMLDECLGGETNVKVRDEWTGDILNVTLEQLFDMLGS